MEFRELLRSAGIAPETVAVALHKPASRAQRLAVCMMAERAPDLLNAYQSTHGKGPEATMKRRKVLASFVAGAAGEMVFCGLFDIRDWTFRTFEELAARPDMIEMGRRLGTAVFPVPDGGEAKGHAHFDLRPMTALDALIGRLVVVDPMNKAYMRLAETTSLEVVEITRERHLVPELPRWDRLILTRSELLDLPHDWAVGLAQWRGVYLIVEQDEGRRYVGSAYGSGDNLLGRWRDHVAGVYGVTKELSALKTETFRFSILQLLTHDATLAEVTRLEHGWMRRLDTIRHGLNSSPPQSAPDVGPGSIPTSASVFAS